MNTKDSMKMLLNFSLSNKRRGWCLNLLGSIRNNPFVLPVFGRISLGLRRSPVTVTCLAVVVLCFGALSVPASARPTCDVGGRGDGTAFGGQIDPQGPVGSPGRRGMDFGRFLFMAKGKMYLAYVVGPVQGLDSDDVNWTFDDNTIRRGRDIAGLRRRRFFVGGDHVSGLPKPKYGDKLPRLGNGVQEWPALTDRAQPVVPAPGSIALGSIGVGVIGWLRRRRTL